MSTARAVEHLYTHGIIIFHVCIIIIFHGDSQSVCTLQFDQFHVCTEMLTVLLCRMQNYTIHNSLYYQ